MSDSANVLRAFAASERFVQPLATEHIAYPFGTLARTPERPDYWFGNYWMLEAEPSSEAFDACLRVWQQAVGGLSGVERLIVQWPASTTEGVSAALIAHAQNLSFEVERSVVMECGALEPASGLFAQTTTAARPLRSDQDWLELVEFAEAEGDPALAASGFVAWRYRAYRELTELGRGQWWGIWRDQRLVASAGLFFEAAVSRLQEVRTHRAFRRQGLCTSLCGQLLAHGTVGACHRTFVVAEPGAPAERVYQRVGFRQVGVVYTLGRAVP